MKAIQSMQVESNMLDILSSLTTIFVSPYLYKSLVFTTLTKHITLIIISDLQILSQLLRICQLFHFSIYTNSFHLSLLSFFHFSSYFHQKLSKLIFDFFTTQVDSWIIILSRFSSIHLIRDCCYGIIKQHVYLCNAIPLVRLTPQFVMR